MDQVQLTHIGRDCLNKARSCLQNLKIFESLRHFLLCLEFLPELRESLHTEFATILNLANDNITRDNESQIEDLQKCYKLALEYYPKSAAVLTNFGTFLLMLGASEASMPYFRKALELHPYSLLADKNLETAKLNLLPRWHFRMLNDKLRNEAFRTAIHNAITPQYNKILDIGCGTGLLSHYSLECSNTKSVIAIESSENLYKIAREMLGTAEKVHLINTHSTDLNNINLSNVLITEIFDAGFFGEWVLGTLVHAWDNLLEPSSKIIPLCGDVFVTGINSQTLLNNHKMREDIPGLNFENICVTQITAEPYESEYLRYYDDIQYVTTTQLAVSVNLADAEFLKNIYTSFDAIEPFILRCTKKCTLHAFAVWFDLHLDDKITITTNPLKESLTCWEQAVVYLDHPLELELGQELNIQFSCVANKVDIKILNRASTCQKCFKVSQRMLRFLNDEQNLQAALKIELPDQCTILELNPFPLFMLYSAKRGLEGEYWFTTEVEEDLKFVKFAWKNSTDCAINFNTNGVYDVIFISPISENGTIDERIFHNFGQYQQKLKQGGLILPKVVNLQLQLIESSYLDVCNTVKDENLLGFNVAKFINEYKIYEHWQLEPKHFPHRILSKSHTNCNILDFHSKDHAEQIYLDVAANGIANGILISFKLVYSDHISISTYDSTSYYCACAICKTAYNVTTSNKIPIKLLYKPGYLKIDICNETCNYKV